MEKLELTEKEKAEFAVGIHTEMLGAQRVIEETQKLGDTLAKNMQLYNEVTFSAIQDMSNRFNDMFQNIKTIDLNPLVLSIQDSLRPILELTWNFNHIGESLKAVYEKICFPDMSWWTAIYKIGNAQCVHWSYLSKDFIESILECEDIDAFLLEYYSANHNQKIESTIAATKANRLFVKYESLYEQSLDAFFQEMYDLAVTGFCCIVDGLLSDISGDITTALKKRIDKILDSLDTDKLLPEKDMTIATLDMTLSNTIYSMSQSISFNAQEPENINRHWIMHGRSQRKKQKIDCIKFINLIYGLMLCNELL